MIKRRSQLATIAAKEIRDAWRTHLLLLLTGFLVLATLVSLTVSAVALHADYLSYIESRDLLISLGKSAADLVPPAFFPLKLMRGFVEHVEIIGAVLGIVLGYRAAAVERGHATLAAFAIWLLLVLIAPQIGDTLDPDNQVAGGVFRTLGIAKPDETEILKSFKTYETARNGIEQASPAKHFERFSFAVLGIKDNYNGQPLAEVVRDRAADLVWLLAIFAALVATLFARHLNLTRLTKES